MQEEIIEGLRNIFKDKLVSIVLFGSYARGTNTSESDIDIAIILNQKYDRESRDKVIDLAVDIDLKYDTVLSIVDINYDKFIEWQEVLPFYKNVKKDGVLLWNAAQRSYHHIDFLRQKRIQKQLGFDASKHSSIIACFNKDYVKTGIFDKRASKIVKSASVLREKSDYEDFYIASKTDTEEQLSNAIEFIKMVEKYMKDKGII